MSESASSRGADALVFASGDTVPAALATRLSESALVIAADGGLANARAVGRHVDVVVGDLDSADPSMLDDAERAGSEIERHPAQKDATDLELAIDTACARGARHITVVGGHGGRVDHFLGNLLLLASPRFEDVELDAWIGAAHITAVRSQATVTGSPGSLCTLLALGGAAHGVTTRGLQYPLSDDVLLPGSTRGVSNVLVGSVASVTVRTGTLLAIQPDALADELTHEVVA